VHVLVPPGEKRVSRVTGFAVLFQMGTIVQKRIAQLEIATLHLDALGAEVGCRAARAALPQILLCR